jgi:NADPH-dependent curcumin reductase CurA
MQTRSMVRRMMEEGRSHTAAFELGKPLAERSVGRVVAWKMPPGVYRPVRR